MALAGLYDIWHSAQGPVYTYTILTTGAGLPDNDPALLSFLTSAEAPAAECCPF
jgi:hypothetical protein